MRTIPPVRAAVNSTTGALPKTSAKKAPQRSYEYIPAGPGSGTLVTTVGRLVTGYACREFFHDFHGRAFELRKLFGGSDPESVTYHLFVGRDPRDHSCTCKGFTYTGGCTHHDALSELARRDAIQPPTPPAVCPTCAGHGFVPAPDPDADPCPGCDGR